MSLRGFVIMTRPSAAEVARGIALVAVCVAATLLLNEQLAATPRGVDVAWVTLTAAGCLPVVFVRSTPVLASTVALGVSLLGMLLGYPMVAPVVVALALVALAATRADVPQTGTLGVLSGTVIAMIAISRADHDQLIAAVGGFAVGMLPALAGEKLRAARAQAADAQELARRAEELRNHDIQRAVAEERLRIARDVHDITGHHLSAIALQAGGAARTSQDPVASATLRRIHELAQETLGQTRRALGVLRDEDEPAALAPLPRLADVDQLITTVRDAGVQAELHVAGDVRDVPEAVEICAYRVIQESLTNVVRHARVDAARVLIAYGPDALTVTIDDEGVGDSRHRDGQGRPGGGLVGMRERLTLIGGDLAAGPRDGGWTVSATLPTVVPG
jgi:signal transduction histidine kinase